MKPHVGSRLIAAMAALGTAFAFAAPAAALAADDATDTSKGTTYYVSSTKGDDANAGTDKDHPWKTLNKVNAIATDLEPGDSVLLERGSTFNNQYLHIKDTSGTPDAPITIADYGDASADKPVIAANGVKGSQWYQDYRGNAGNHLTRGTVSTTVLLKDVSYITVKNLEITNDDPDVYDPIDTWQWTDTADSDGTKLDRSANRMDRTGVAGIAENGTTMSHVTLDGLNIHDVDGNLYNKHMANGGIYFMAHYARENKTAADNTWLQNHISRFDHITIKNNVVKDVDRWGIAVGYTTYLNFIDADINANQGNGEIADDLIAKYGQTNVTIENNYVKGAGGDAITLMYCDRPVIQYNVGDSVSKHINTADYTQAPLNNTGVTRVGYGRVAAGIWPWRCKDPVFQYNEMYNNLNATHGNGDGQAWDADYGDGTLYQYNYSYGNSFASLMICNWYAVNTTFRYNISQNDRQGVFDLPSNGPGNHIYNNTAYIGEDSRVLTGRSNAQAQFENNIFINATEAKKTETWNIGSYNGGQTYDNNLYVNYANTPASDKNAKTADSVSDVLADAGKAPTAPQASGAIYDRTAADNKFAGYAPKAGSVAINNGKVISDMNDYAVTNDFLGNAIKGKPDLGAIESDADPSAPTEPTGTVDAYETGADGDTKLVYVPFTEKNPTTVKQLRGGVTAGEGTVANVYRTVDGKLTKLEASDAVKDGDVLRFELDGVDGSKTIDYTVKQKNTWNWVNDYRQGGNGPVWQPQRQTAADSDWQTITTYDSSWPNSVYNTYYGAGVNGELSGLNGDRTQTHGLLADDPAAAGGTAMAWQSPKSGTVKLSLKDGFTDNSGKAEPYLRQTGNTGGKVTLSLMKNNDVICTADLATSLEPSTAFAECVKSEKGTIEVAKGDWVRIVAVAEQGATKPSLYVSPVIAYQDVAAPAAKQADTYTPAYPATDATVGKQATAEIAFTDADGKAATVEGVKSYTVKGEANGIAVDATTGAATLTPTAEQYGQNVTATVTVTYADDSTDEATVTFTVAKSDAQRLNVIYPTVSGNAGVDLKRAPKFTLKADSAAAAIPAGTTFALGSDAPAGAKVDAKTGVVTLNSTVGGTIVVPVVVTFADTNETLETTATFNVTAPAALGSAKLETGVKDGKNVIYVPFTEKNPTTVEQLLAKVTAEPETAAKAVYRDGKKLDADAAIKAGDVLRFSAEGSSVTADYTVVQKNAWSWVDDFKTAEGVLWNSQRQDGDDWANVTSFSSQWPMSVYNSYYGAGLTGDLADLPAVGGDRSGRQGLLIDDPAATGGTAIAWAVPKTGKVTVTLERDNEPQRRNAGATGDVTLALTHNGDVICTTTISKAQTKDQAFVDCLESKGTFDVTDGDVVRLVATAASDVRSPDLYVSPVITYVDDADTPEPPAKTLAEQYEAAYPAETAAKVGEKASASVTFTKDGAAADAPAGTTYAVAGDGLAVAADGAVSLTPTDAQAGTTVTGTVTVTYSDKSTDTAAVSFKVAEKDTPVPPAKTLAEQYEAAYPAETAAKVGEKSSAAVSFTKDGETASAPEGTAYKVTGEGLTVGADGAVSLTPTEAQAGTTVAGTVTVTYSDGSTDTAKVAFKVAEKETPVPPAKTLAEQYEAAYPDKTAAKVGEKASASVSFTKDGVAAAAPAGTTYAVAGDGFAVAADGAVSLTPTEADYGKTLTGIVTVTYSDGTTDTAKAVFKVAEKETPVPPTPTPDDTAKDKLQAAVDAAGKLNAKDYTAETWTPFAKALADAKKLLANPDATDDQLSGALTTLTAAQAALKTVDTGKGEDGKGDGKTDGKGNGLSKTGSEVAVVVAAGLLLAAAGIGLAYTRRSRS